MNRMIQLVSAALLVVLASSCSMVRTLKSESGLYNVKLERHAKVYVDGIWTWGKGNPYEHDKNGSIYIAPLDISKVQKAQPKLAPLMVPQMHDFVVKEVSKSLREANAANGTNWHLAKSPSEATIRVDMALVHFRPQRPGMRVLSSLGGPFVKIPGVSDVVGNFAKGDICLEMTIRDTKTGQLLLACKDSNGDSAWLISAEAYSKKGNADVNLRHWAERLAYLVRISAHDKLGDKTLKQLIKKRGWGEVISERLF